MGINRVKVTYLHLLGDDAVAAGIETSMRVKPIWPHVG